MVDMSIVVLICDLQMKNNKVPVSIGMSEIC